MQEFKQMLQNNYDSVSQGIAGVNSYVEYLERLKLRTLDFLDPDSSEDTFTLIADRLGKKVVHLLTRSDYEWAQDHYDDVNAVRQIALNQSGDTHEMTAKDIVDQFDDSVENMSLQIEYLNMMIDDESEVKKNVFIDKLTNVYPNMAKDKITRFADYIENSDAITSIKNFFSEASDWMISKTVDQSSDEVIEVLAASDYVSDVPIWIGGICQFVEQIGSFFTEVFKFTLNIVDFLKNLGKAFINLLTWIITKVNRNLMSNYEFTKRSNGILDIPLLQAKICYLDSELNPLQGPVSFIGSHDVHVFRAINCEKYTKLFAHGTQEGNLYEQQWRTLLSGVFKKTWNNQIIRNVTEVILPCVPGLGWNSDYVPISFSIRVGPGSDNFGYLQLIPIIQVSTVQDMTDHKIAASINYSFNWIAHKFRPYFNIMGSSALGEPGSRAVLWTDNQYTLLNPSTIDVTNEGPYDLVGNAWFFSPDDMALNDPTGWEFSALVCSFLLPYFILNSDYFTNIITLINGDHLTVGRINYLLGMGTELSHTVSQSISYYAAESNQDFIDMADTYKPYSTYKKLPVAAHYQTVVERKTEVTNTIWAIIIIAAAAYLTVRYASFKKKRTYYAKSLEASVDARLWENATTPGSFDPKQIYKDWKKSNRVSFTNSLLGIGTTSTITSGLGAFMGSASSLTETCFSNMSESESDIHNDVVTVGRMINPSFNM